METGEAAKSRKPLQRIVCRSGGNIEVVPVHRIDYIEAQDDYIHVFSKGQKAIKQQTLGELEELLDPLTLRARAPQLHREPGEPGASRALREGQPGGGAEG